LLGYTDLFFPFFLETRTPPFFLFNAGGGTFSPQLIQDLFVAFFAPGEVGKPFFK